MFDNIMKFFKKFIKEEKKDSKDTAKERLHLVLMQDRANVSADFMELMKQEIIEVIKKYIDVDENSIDVKLTNKVNNDGTTGVPMLYANIPIVNVKDDAKQVKVDREIPKKDEKEKAGNLKEDTEKNEEKEDKVEQEEVKEDIKEDIKEEVNSEVKDEAKQETAENIEEKQKDIENKEETEEQTNQKKVETKKEVNKKQEVKEK